MKSFGTPHKLKSLYYDSACDEAGTLSVSVERHNSHQRSVNDRDRRRQIIAKLAQKRKQYQRGIGKAERESFQQRVKTSIIKHKQQKERSQNKAIKPIQSIPLHNAANVNTTHQKHGNQEKNQDEHKKEEEEEHKSVSISTSLSISPIHPQHHSHIASHSSSNSPCIPSHHNDDDTLLYSEDMRNEEIRMLRAQNQRLSNKLEHVNTELVETSVFLRSERKRNKNLFNELKVKERQIQDLTQQLDELETEVEEKDKKCVECVERLSEAEQETNAISANLSNKIKQSYNDIKEWQHKYSQIQSQHKLNVNGLKEEFKQLKGEMLQRQGDHDRLMESIHRIIETLQYEIKHSSKRNSVSKQLNAMLSQDETHTDVNVLLQALIGVIDKSDQQTQHNHELTLCLAKYEKDIEASKHAMIGYQEALQRLEENITDVTKEKIEMEQKANQSTKELQKMYETVFTATSDLQDIARRVTNNHDIGDININQCIEIIADSLNNNRMNTQKLKSLLTQISTKHSNQMDAVGQIFRSVSGKWSQRILILQDRLSSVQIELLRRHGCNASYVSTMSNMSMVSDVNKSFRVDDMELQCSQQIALIHELRDDINDKQKTIESLIQKSDDIQDTKYEQICKERDDALHDFQHIAEEWQNMEKHIETTYDTNESLQKQLNDWKYWMRYMVQYMNQHMNDRNHDTAAFESISNDIPNELRPLHSCLVHIWMRMTLSDLNETTSHDIDDDALLEQLFGKMEPTDETQIELEGAVHTLEAEICLENIIHKVELSHIGNEAEKIIVAYQERLKTYHGFIRELQAKVSQSSKLMHAITLERDHAWSQYKQSEKEVHKLNTQHTELHTTLSDARQQLQSSTQQLTDLKKETEVNSVQMESMTRRLQLNHNTNMDLHQRLHDSTELIHEITKQRDEFQTSFVDLSNKFIEYKRNCDVLFKRTCDAVAEGLNPLMMKLNESVSMNHRIEDITGKVKRLKDYVKREQNAMEETKTACEKSAISKLRMHADIHRFHFAKLLQEMKQKYEVHIAQLQARMASLQDKFTALQTEFEQQTKDKAMLQSQLIEVKKTFNAEIVNYQNVENQTKQKEMQFTEMINNLQKELVERNKHSENMEHEIRIHRTKREDVQHKLNEQTKKTKKLHSKAVKLQNELRNVKEKYSQTQQKLHNIENGNKDYTLQIEQLQALNESLNDGLRTKEMNHTKMTEIYVTKIDELKEALVNVETVNNDLNNKWEMQQNELRQCMEQLERTQTSNKEAVQKLESLKHKGTRDEREWLDREEDLRHEIQITRQQLHETTNDLGTMKLDTLEKDTLVKKLQNEMNGLHEEILFYKEREGKERNEKERLSQHIAQHNKCNEQKINDIKMIMDAKAVRILQLEEDVAIKSNGIKTLQSQVIQLQREVSATKGLMNKEKCCVQDQSHENNKLQMIINDLSNELELMKKERRELNQEIETQKNVNVELSLELDSMKQYKEELEKEESDHYMFRKSLTTDDVLKRCTNNLLFFDEDLEKSRISDVETTSFSMPNMNSNDDDPKPRRKPMLPIPRAAAFQSSSKLPSRRNNTSCRSLFGGNAENVDNE